MSTSLPLNRPLYSISSLSLGSNLYHDLPTKIRVANELRYDGIEIFIPDFEAFVAEVRTGKHASLFSPLPPREDPDLERKCARAISGLCESLSLQIPVLQPFRSFENFASHEPLVHALDDAERWLALMPLLKTDLLLVCSNFLEGSNQVDDGKQTMNEYMGIQVKAFTMLGERAKKYGVRVGYEPLAWGTLVNHWEQVWEVVEKVNLPNVGIILDSFNSLGNQYADPSLPSGVRPLPLSTLQANLSKLSCTIPSHKLFLYQVADAQKPASLVVSSPAQPARMTWSRSSRLFPCEGGYLPVDLYTEAVVRTGYKGWWSLEVFNTSLMESDEGCPRRHGVRGIRGLHTLWEQVLGRMKTGVPEALTTSAWERQDFDLSMKGSLSRWLVMPSIYKIVICGAALMALQVVFGKSWSISVQ